MSARQAGAVERGRVSRRARTWAPALLGPGAWFVDLSARYFLVESGVAAAHPVAVAAVGLVCLSIAAAASAAGWRWHQRLPPEERSARFVALLGAVLAGYSTLVIAATLLPHLFFDGAARV